jgi:O-antigen ligase
MSLTAILFLLIYCGGLLCAVFKHPKYGLYTYLFAFYMHPPDRWWRADVPDLRWSALAGFLTLVLTLTTLRADPTRPSWLRTSEGRFYALLLFWMAVQSVWSITGGYHAEAVDLITKYTLLFYLIYRLVDSEKEMIRFFVAHVLGSFYLGWVAFGREIHGRLENMGGPGIDDANTFGMHLSTAAIFGAALLLRGPNSLRALVLVTMPFILNGVILTQSRGAFLGLVAAVLAVIFLQPKAKRLLFYSLAALGFTLFLVLSPPQFLERISTITAVVDEEQEVDQSASTRIELIRAQWQMWKDHPLGTGHRGTLVLSPQYLDEHYLTFNQHGYGEDLVRSSHNTLMTFLVEHGFPGVILYIGVLVAALRALRAMKDLDRDKDRLEANFSLSAYRMALGGAIALIVVSGMFSNYFKAEVFVWLLALVASLRQLVNTAIEVESAPPKAQVARVNHSTARDESIRVRP